jgi:hypothetical protein
MGEAGMVVVVAGAMAAEVDTAEAVVDITAEAGEAATVAVAAAHAVSAVAVGAVPASPAAADPVGMCLMQAVRASQLDITHRWELWEEVPTALLAVEIISCRTITQRPVRWALDVEGWGINIWPGIEALVPEG